MLLMRLVSVLAATYVTADWCGPCKVFKPLAIRVFEEYGVPLDIVDALDIDPEFNVRSLPTILFDNGDRMVGAWPEAKLREKIESLMAARNA